MIHPPVILSAASLVPSGLSNWLLVAGMVLIIAWMVVGIRRRRRRWGKQVTAREQLERSRNREAIRGDLESLMVEIEQFAKRMSAQLDAKAMRLERLIDQAQRVTHDSEPPRPASDADAGEGDGQGAPADQSAPHREKPHGGGGIRVPQAVEDPLTRSVYELADQGRTAPQIAEELAEHIGKVELILALRSH